MRTDQQRIRCIGLELGGGKSARTAMAVVDYYSEDKKIFLAACEAEIQGTREWTGDEVLLSLLREQNGQILAVNAPLTLPPCFACALPTCPGYRKCTVPEVEWMRKEGERLKLDGHKAPTPYTQRPIDLAIRGQLQDGLLVPVAIDETMGAGPAPLVARMRYLSRHLAGLEFFELNPRLVTARFSQYFGFSARQLKRYRDITEGYEQRCQMLRLMGRAEERLPRLFLYEEDLDLVAREIALFDALMCAMIGAYHVAGLTEENLFSPTWGSSLVPRARHPREWVKAGDDLS